MNFIECKQLTSGIFNLQAVIDTCRFSAGALLSTFRNSIIAAAFSDQLLGILGIFEFSQITSQCLLNETENFTKVEESLTNPTVLEKYFNFRNMDVAEIVNILAEFTSLDADELHAKVVASAYETGKHWQKPFVDIFLKFCLCFS